MAEVTERPLDEIEQELEAMAAELRDRESGVTLKQVGGGWRLFSHADVRPYLEQFASSPTATRLSQAALETLSVVAYRQPVTRGQVSEIRGVDSERSLQTLERLGMVAEVGTAPGPGSAILYGTTELFIEKLGLNDLSELPPLADHVPPPQVVEALERPFRPEDGAVIDLRDEDDS